MSKANARFIPGDEITHVTDWNFSAVDQASLRFAAKLKAQADQEERLRESGARQTGYNEGYSKGFEQGHAQATLEGQRLINEYISNQGDAATRNVSNLFASAQTQLADAQQVMAKGVLELACELARQVLRAEISTNPNALQPVIREALGLLQADSKVALVRMHPQDIEVFSDVLQQEFANLSLTLLPDASITRGGCLVESAGTVVDGTVEKRWHKAVARLGLDSAWDDADEHA
jgi:flagellar assembly protein FliH